MSTYTQDAREQAEQIISDGGFTADADRFDRHDVRGFISAALQAARGTPQQQQPTTPLLKTIIEICDLETAQEFGDADERLRAIRGLIVGENV